MLQKLFLQFKIFSRENWWIYFLLIISIWVVLFTGKWNIYEVLFILFINILGSLCVLMMQNAYKDGKYMTWAYFLLFGNMFYFFIAFYSALFNAEYQYLLWQLWFQLSWLKIYLLYIWGKTFTFINLQLLWLISVMTLIVAIFFFKLWLYQVIQSFGFAGVILGFWMVDDVHRYFSIFVWNFLITLGAYIWLYINFLSGDIFGVTVSFAILWTSTFLFYLKILPTYISRFKNT
jgi:hypothetical protein